MCGWAFRHWDEHSVKYAMAGISLHGRTVEKICKGGHFVMGTIIRLNKQGRTFNYWEEQSVNMQGWAFPYWDELSVKYARVQGRSLVFSVEFSFLGLTVTPSNTHACIVHKFFLSKFSDCMLLFKTFVAS
jgi:hypothetical protein